MFFLGRFLDPKLHKLCAFCASGVRRQSWFARTRVRVANGQSGGPCREHRHQQSGRAGTLASAVAKIKWHVLPLFVTVNYIDRVNIGFVRPHCSPTRSEISEASSRRRPLEFWNRKQARSRAASRAWQRCRSWRQSSSSLRAWALTPPGPNSDRRSPISDSRQTVLASVRVNHLMRAFVSASNRCRSRASQPRCTVSPTLCAMRPATRRTTAPMAVSTKA